MPESMICHSCPADGTEHEASADCACNPAKLSDTEWMHFGEVVLAELNDALANGGRA